STLIHCSRDDRALHSFPTRRSSDLSPLPRREVILISDFQRRGWEQTPGRDDVRLPDKTVVTPVAVGDPSSANLSVTPVSLQRTRSEEHTSELQSLAYLVCRLLLEKK